MFLFLSKRCVCGASALILSACAGSIQPASEHLSAWTAELRDQQPEDAFAAIYDHADNALIFVAAKHATKTDSLTFKLIKDAYASFRIDTVIVEGFSYSRGSSSTYMAEWASRKKAVDGFQEAGEAVPAILGALREGAIFFGGEADDTDIRDRMFASAYSPADLIGFYTLRSIPQWIRERKITSAGDPGLRALIEDELVKNRKRLKLEGEVFTGYDAWAQWYAETNGKPIGADFELEETGPLSDGRYGSNKIAAAISRSRAEFLQARIVDHLNAGETVMVVFGASHLMIHRAALDHMLGAPCYVGQKFEAALDACDA